MLYLNDAYTKVRRKPFFGLLALDEGKSGKRAWPGDALSPNKSEAIGVSLLESLEIPEVGKGLLVIYDGMNDTLSSA